MASDDKHAAVRSIIDPLIEPEPSALDGPGSHFSVSTTTTSPSTAAAPISANTTGRSSTNPFRRSSEAYNTSPRHGSVEKTGNVTTHSRQVSEGQSTHRSRASSDLRHQALARESPVRRSADHSRQGSAEYQNRPRRSSSLRQRYPGDPTDHPLDMLKQENKLANRSPHLRKKHQPRPDSVDILDKSGLSYHHEGPYDAALFVRNNSYTSSPVAALQMTNAEAIKATPEDKIRDSLNDHRPLDGVAMVPSGQRDAFGRLYKYEEGADLMHEPSSDGGQGLRRWPGIQYHPDDLKGKGEPSYSIEKALKEHDAHAERHGREDDGIELAHRPKPSTDERQEPIDPEHGQSSGAHSQAQSYGDWEKSRRSSHAHKLSDGIKRRVGSLRRKDPATTA